MRAGFAHYKGGGEWVFLNDKLRDMLAEFGAELQRNERERCARLIEPTGVRPGGACCAVREFDALTYAAKLIRDA